eukprot:TRINITY_DN6175_c0_g1_i9.p1 TRINITY_DN6175_c0_g1~~TRINITY_DN6175_c0_g1_i9.p1  ORF type:complete len:579 (-),score=152.79 TRINITY_DN6175_c0_g1_i9:141-1877(-)
MCIRDSIPCVYRINYNCMEGEDDYLADEVANGVISDSLGCKNDDKTFDALISSMHPIAKEDRVEAMKGRLFSEIKHEFLGSNEVVIETAKCLMNDVLNKVKADIKITDFGQGKDNKYPHDNLFSKIFNNKIMKEKLKQIDEELKQEKIKEITKQKEELEIRLSTINKNIALLKSKNLTLANSKRTSIQEDGQKEKEAIAFVKRMQAEKHERRKKAMRRLNLSSEKIKNSNDKNNRLVPIDKPQKKESKSHSVDRVSLEALKKPSEYLYRKLESKYNAEVVLPGLQEKERELVKRKNRYKAFDWTELYKHQEEHDKLLAEHSMQRGKVNAERKVQEDVYKVLRKQMQNSISEKCALIDLKEKEEKELKEKRKLELRDKINRYSELIKDVIAIRPNPEKAAELNLAISRLKHPVREKRDTRHLYDISSIVQSRQRTPRLNSKKKLSKQNFSLIKETPANSKASAEIDWNEKKFKKIGNGSARNILITDYLAEQRRKRLNENRPTRVSKEWKRDLENPDLDAKEKYNRVIAKVARIEGEAKMKERLLNARGGAEQDPEMGKDVNDMLLEAIKAKLAILDQM